MGTASGLDKVKTAHFRVGVDIGGTFTDIVFLDENGVVLTAKVLSTPDDYNRGILEGIERVFAENRVSGAQVRELLHGTTIATNAILERKGARTALVTTEGFRDVLEIRRLRMPALFDLRWEKPQTLVRRADRAEVPERITAAGTVERALDYARAREVLRHMLAEGVESVAICLINAYSNGVHEREVAALVHELNPNMPVCLSSRVLPEIKEYERTSTTVVNAYIMPVVRRYLGSMRSRLQAAGIEAPLRIMQSSGGTMGLDAACERPIHIIESGPASGVVGAAELAACLGHDNVLTFDMGGTTAKASMVENGRFDRVGSLHVGAGINMSGQLFSGSGYHVGVPAIDIAEVGAGGGSLVTIDSGGALRIGPESAGASPGPVCYGLGGIVPTVTDANVVLGFVNPEQLAGGTLRLDSARAAAAITEQVAQPFGISLEEAAWGIHIVADALMARALRAVSSERGRDPRAFALMAFGGNGGVHAATLARSLAMTRILVPPVSGVFSALGLLFPETEHHLVQTFKHALTTADSTAIEARFAALEAEGAAALGREGFGPAQTSFERLADLRYSGENAELTVPVPAGAWAGAKVAAAFASAHERKYGFSSGGAVAELVNLRVITRGERKSSGMPGELDLRVGSRVGQRADPRRVYFGGDDGWLDCPVLSREEIGTHWRPGPLLVDEYDTSTVVPPRCRIRRSGWNILELELDGD